MKETTVIVVVIFIIIIILLVIATVEFSNENGLYIVNVIYARKMLFVSLLCNVIVSL